jgi:hypothetical protein
MTYNITKSDGSHLVDVQDGTIDQTTDLKLIGKNSTSFGESLNENLVYLLENFSNSSPPTKPIMGQLWYNTDTSGLQIYTGNVTGWRSTGSPIVKNVSPTSFVTGDLWIDSNNKQLWFYDGSALTLAGPSWTKSQGQTGFVPETIFDTFGNPKTILNLYVNDNLLGIYSAVDFDPKPAIPGFTSIIKGYNSNSLIASTFDLTVSNSLKLGGVNANYYARTDGPVSLAGPLAVTSQYGISVGPLSNASLNLSGITFHIENTQENGDIAIRTKNTSGVSERIYINATTGCVGISNNNPQKALDVTGNTRITGDLEVSGKILTKPLVLTLIDNDILSTIQASTKTILQTVANESNYLNGQQAFVHYQHINFGTSVITRHSSRYIISSEGVWTYVADL